MSKQVNIRFRLKTLGGNIRMITRDAYEYFKNEPDILRVSDITRLLHCSKTQSMSWSRTEGCPPFVSAEAF